MKMKTDEGLAESPAGSTLGVVSGFQVFVLTNPFVALRAGPGPGPKNYIYDADT